MENSEFDYRSMVVYRIQKHPLHKSLWIELRVKTISNNPFRPMWYLRQHLAVVSSLPRSPSFTTCQCSTSLWFQGCDLARLEDPMWTIFDIIRGSHKHENLHITCCYVDLFAALFLFCITWTSGCCTFENMDFRLSTDVCFQIWVAQQFLKLMQMYHQMDIPTSSCMKNIPYRA